MRRNVLEHRDTGGAIAIALAIVLLYSLWGASLLHTQHTGATVAEEQKTFAVK